MFVPLPFSQSSFVCTFAIHHACGFFCISAGTTCHTFAQRRDSDLTVSCCLASVGIVEAVLASLPNYQGMTIDRL
jgi:hypothetical protein